MRPSAVARLGTLAFLTLLAPATLHAYSTGPPADHVGLCSARATCRASGCHDDSPLNSGTALAAFKLSTGPLPATYRAGELLRFVLSVVDPDPTRLRFGFEIGAVSDCPLPAQAGTLSVVEPMRTRLATANQITFVEHTCFVLGDPAACGYLPATPGMNSWTFDWLAPDPVPGSVTFYWALNAADGSFDQDGDYISTGEATIEALCPSRITSLRAVKAFCDTLEPTVQKVALTWTDPPGATGTRVYRTETRSVLTDPSGLGATLTTACDDPPGTASLTYYTVVGLCRDGSDGPL